MSYYIEYTPEQAKRYPSRRRKNTNVSWRIIAGISLSALLIYGLSIQKIRNFLIPGDPDTTIRATAELFENVQEGVRWTDAFAAFCETVVTDGVG